MDLLTWGRSPWGEWILTHISWDLLWASLFAGLAFLVAHASYMVLSRHRKRDTLETDRLEAARSDLPDRIPRHSLAARLFHWVMAAAMFVLLFTAFLPIVGIQFAWVTWHWMAGLVLTASILFHLVHATVWMDFWSIWVGPKGRARAQGGAAEGAWAGSGAPKSGKYPLGMPVSLGHRDRWAARRRQRLADDGSHPNAVFTRTHTYSAIRCGASLTSRKGGRGWRWSGSSSRTCTSLCGPKNGGITKSMVLG